MRDRLVTLPGLGFGQDIGCECNYEKYDRGGKDNRSKGRE